MFKKIDSKKPRTTLTDLPAQSVRPLELDELRIVSGGMHATYDIVERMCYGDADRDTYAGCG